jgi:hypothetical protein
MRRRRLGEGRGQRRRAEQRCVRGGGRPANYVLAIKSFFPHEKKKIKEEESVRDEKL